MRRRLQIAALGLALVGLAPGGSFAHAQSPAHFDYRFDMTMTLSRSTSDVPDARVVRVTGFQVIHLVQHGAGFNCTEDPMHLTAFVNGVVRHEDKPGASCGDGSGSGSMPPGFDGAFNSPHLNARAGSADAHWQQTETMSVADALNIPVDPQVAAVLPAVHWTYNYTRTPGGLVESGAANLLADPTIGATGARLHAHLHGVVQMHMGIVPSQWGPRPTTLHYHSTVQMFVAALVPGGAAGANEHDGVVIDVTMRPLVSPGAGAR